MASAREYALDAFLEVEVWRFSSCSHFFSFEQSSIVDHSNRTTNIEAIGTGKVQNLDKISYFMLNASIANTLAADSCN
jgi:hypothetical protein